MAQIVMCICEHYHVHHDKIANWRNDPDWRPSKLAKVTKARQLLIYHMHDCGMSYEAIGKFLKLTVSTVEGHRAQGKRLVLNGMRDFVDELPRVTSSLEILRK